MFDYQRVIPSQSLCFCTLVCAYVFLGEIASITHLFVLLQSDFHVLKVARANIWWQWMQCAYCRWNAAFHDGHASYISLDRSVFMHVMLIRLKLRQFSSFSSASCFGFMLINLPVSSWCISVFVDLCPSHCHLFGAFLLPSGNDCYSLLLEPWPSRKSVRCPMFMVELASSFLVKVYQRVNPIKSH